MSCHLHEVCIGDKCMLLSTSISRSLLHDYTVVERATSVDSVIMFDRSSISDGARVVQSVLAPDSSIAGVFYSLLLSLFLNFLLAFILSLCFSASLYFF